MGTADNHPQTPTEMQFASSPTGTTRRQHGQDMFVLGCRIKPPEKLFNQAALQRRQHAGLGAPRDAGGKQDDRWHQVQRFDHRIPAVSEKVFQQFLILAG